MDGGERKRERKDKIMNLFVKWLIPSSDKLAGYAASGIQKGVNSCDDDKKSAIAKYSTIATQASELSVKLTQMLNNGNIDDVEKGELKELIKPLIDKVMEVL